MHIRPASMSILHSRYLRYLVTFAAALCVNVSVQGCESRTELEEIYCQLRHEYRSLPNLDDFRRNSPAIQRLLLKRPSAQEGINLPEAVEKFSSTSGGGTSSPHTSIATKQTVVSRGSNRLFPLPIEAEDKPKCELIRALIRCGEAQYGLVQNQQNKALSKGSLGAENRLSFTPLAGQTDAEYWSNSYRVYIESMLSIGLGASTMSYTKFVYSWRQAEQQGLSAELRFSAMFNYLKRDKQNLSIKNRYDEQLPSSFHWCQSIADHLIVCDNRVRNWVYALRVSHSE